MKPGLISITFRQLSTKEIVALCLKAGLEGVEWGGDVHCPHGDISAARELRELCASSGLSVSSYGSYYKAADSEAAGLSFRKVLDSAVALGAPRIRVWPGSRPSAKTDASQRRALVDDLNRICRMASEEGVKISLEYHLNSLTDDPASVEALLSEVPDALFQWQPVQGRALDAKLSDLKAIPLSRLGNVHVFEWEMTESGRIEKRPLSKGAESWRSWLKAASGAPACEWALLEFVKDDSPESLLADAGTLLSILPPR